MNSAYSRFVHSLKYSGGCSTNQSRNSPRMRIAVYLIATWTVSGILKILSTVNGTTVDSWLQTRQVRKKYSTFWIRYCFRNASFTYGEILQAIAYIMNKFASISYHNSLSLFCMDENIWQKWFVDPTINIESLTKSHTFSRNILKSSPSSKRPS